MSGRSSISQGIGFRVPKATHKKIHELAQAKGIKFSDLMRDWCRKCYAVEIEQLEQVSQRH